MTSRYLALAVALDGSCEFQTTIFSVLNSVFETPLLKSFEFCDRFLLGFAFPPIWYCATVLYLGKYYLKDPRERSGLAASAIAVSRL